MSKLAERTWPCATAQCIFFCSIERCSLNWISDRLLFTVQWGGTTPARTPQCGPREKFRIRKFMVYMNEIQSHEPVAKLNSRASNRIRSLYHHHKITFVCISFCGGRGLSWLTLFLVLFVFVYLLKRPHPWVHFALQEHLNTDTKMGNFLKTLL